MRICDFDSMSWSISASEKNSAYIYKNGKLQNSRNERLHASIVGNEIYSANSGVILQLKARKFLSNSD